jgi:hypothetical protein
MLKLLRKKALNDYSLSVRSSRNSATSSEYCVTPTNNLFSVCLPNLLLLHSRPNVKTVMPKINIVARALVNKWGSHGGNGKCCTVSVTALIITALYSNGDSVVIDYVSAGS